MRRAHDSPHSVPACTFSDSRTAAGKPGLFWAPWEIRNNRIRARKDEDIVKHLEMVSHEQLVDQRSSGWPVKTHWKKVESESAWNQGKAGVGDSHSSVKRPLLDRVRKQINKISHVSSLWKGEQVQSNLFKHL